MDSEIIMVVEQRCSINGLHSKMVSVQLGVYSNRSIYKINKAFALIYRDKRLIYW